MPSSQAILEGLTHLANDWIDVAIAWHLLLALATLSLVARGRLPSRRVLALVTIAPLLSVAGLAWLGNNPFNALVFAAFALVTIGIAAGLPPRPARLGPGWATTAGALTLAFGWCYPHFLTGSSWLYVVAAPIGIVPCPTLAIVLGVGLLFDRFGSRAWALTMGSLGLFYGLFGVVRLGVWLDVPLVLAACAMLARALPRALLGRVLAA